MRQEAGENKKTGSVATEPAQAGRPYGYMGPRVTAYKHSYTGAVCDAARLTGSIPRDELLEKSSWLVGSYPAIQSIA